MASAPGVAPDPSPSHDDMPLVHHADIQRGGAARSWEIEVRRSGSRTEPHLPYSNFDLRSSRPMAALKLAPHAGYAPTPAVRQTAMLTITTMGRGMQPGAANLEDGI